MKGLIAQTNALSTLGPSPMPVGDGLFSFTSFLRHQGLDVKLYQMMYFAKKQKFIILIQIV